MPGRLCLVCKREFREPIYVCPDDGTLLTPNRSDLDSVRQIVPDIFEMMELIGAGSTGMVYKVRHRKMKRIVALKILRLELANDAVAIRRFHRDARAASLLSHPNIVTLLDFGIMETGQPYFVMDYLPGTSLQETIKRHGPIDAQRCVKIFSEIADALEHAHARGVVQRDLKSSDIMLINDADKTDFVKLLDFGLAKLRTRRKSMELTDPGEIVGTPVYMSPEQCTGKKVGPQTDMYSLGIILFEALTGKPPFEGTTWQQIVAKHLYEPPPHLAQANSAISAPEGMEHVVFKMLAKQPAERYLNMTCLKDALQEAVN